MSQASVNTQIDTDITNKTAAESITAANVGNNMKAVNNRIEEAIAENIQNNLMPSATKAVTANAVLAGLESVALPYKSYIASLSQSGTSAPVANVIYNNLGQNITWSRIGVGEYKGVLTDPAVLSTSYLAFPNNANFGETMFTRLGDDLSVTTAVSGTYQDDRLANCYIELRIYN